MDVINKANLALNAIKLIRKFFNTKELITLVTSNFYSVLFYNSEVWHVPSLNQDLKHRLSVAAATALKMCLHHLDNAISHYDLPIMTNRATPEMFREYKAALLLFKTFNDKTPEKEWLHLNFNIINTTRQTRFMTKRDNSLKIGLNCPTNRFYVLNNKIPLMWFNKSFDSYKIECKSLFLSF